MLSTSFIELEWKYRCAQISYSTANFFFASFVGNILYFERCISRKPRCTSNSQIPLNDLDFFPRKNCANSTQIFSKYFQNLVYKIILLKLYVHHVQISLKMNKNIDSELNFSSKISFSYSK